MARTIEEYEAILRRVEEFLKVCVVELGRRNIPITAKLWDDVCEVLSTTYIKTNVDEFTPPIFLLMYRVHDIILYPTSENLAAKFDAITTYIDVMHGSSNARVYCFRSREELRTILSFMREARVIKPTEHYFNDKETVVDTFRENFDNQDWSGPW